jgi:CheY-like chemotaxis protein
MDADGTRVLLVEDDRFLRKAAEATLRQHGYVVLTAADGEEALRVARAERPALVLLDLIMPKMQGFEVLRTLKADPVTAGIPEVRGFVMERRDASTIRAWAIARGMKTMFQDGLGKAILGETTMDEVVRAAL